MRMPKPAAKGSPGPFNKPYGGPVGPIETLKHGSPKGGGKKLPSPAKAGNPGPFPKGYGGPVGPIETLKHGSMSPRPKKKRYPSCATAAKALGKRGGY